MKPIRIIKDGKYKGQYVFKGDFIEPIQENIELIEALNKGGFIEPLTIKEIIEIKKMGGNIHFINKEEE